MSFLATSRSTRDATSPSFFARRRHAGDLTPFSSPIVPPPSVSYHSPIKPRLDFSDAFTKSRELSDKENDLNEKEKRLERLKEELSEMSEQLTQNKRQQAQKELDLQRKERDLGYKIQILEEKRKSFSVNKSKFNTELSNFQRESKEILEMRAKYEQLTSDFEKEIAQKVAQNDDRSRHLDDLERKLNEQFKTVSHREEQLSAESDRLKTLENDLSQRFSDLLSREHLLEKTIEEQEQLSRHLDEREGLIQSNFDKLMTRRDHCDSVGCQVEILTDFDIKCREDVLQDKYFELKQKEDQMTQEVNQIMIEWERIQENFVNKENEFNQVYGTYQERLSDLENKESHILENIKNRVSEFNFLIELIVKDHQSEPEILELLTCLQSSTVPPPEIFKKAANKIKNLMNVKHQNTVDASLFQQLNDDLINEKECLVQKIAEIEDLGHSGIKNKVSKIKNDLMMCSIPSLPLTEDHVGQYFKKCEDCRKIFETFDNDLNGLIDEISEHDLFTLSSP
ncbi:hypothetical protein P9112_005096 [Eukaryota sp. TZLM1-RC]